MLLTKFSPCLWSPWNGGFHHLSVLGRGRAARRTECAKRSGCALHASSLLTSGGSYVGGLAWGSGMPASSLLEGVDSNPCLPNGHDMAESQGSTPRWPLVLSLLALLPKMSLLRRMGKLRESPLEALPEKEPVVEEGEEKGEEKGGRWTVRGRTAVGWTQLDSSRRRQHS